MLGHEDVCGGVLGRVGVCSGVLGHEDVCGGVRTCVEACWSVLTHEDTCYPMPEPLARPQLHTCHHVRTRCVLKRVGCSPVGLCHLPGPTSPPHLGVFTHVEACWRAGPCCATPMSPCLRMTARVEA